jgi:manganese oxidase
MLLTRVFRWCRTISPYLGAAVIMLLMSAAGARAQTVANPVCERSLTADVVAFDQVFFWNRYGAVEPQGMIFALKGDVVPKSGSSLSPGNVQLREGKRPRPLILRMNVGDCLMINFTNYLNPTPVDDDQPATRQASVHVVGLQLVGSIASDGSFVGVNPSSLINPGLSTSYTYYAEREGIFMFHSGGATVGGEGDGGQLNSGLFGAVTVQPRGAEWYRSQVTKVDLDLATTGHTADNHPIINYNACFPDGASCSTKPPTAKPVLKMRNGNNQIVHSDVTAIITVPQGTYRANATEPNRDEPFREFALLYHDEVGAVQAFPIFEDPVMSHTLHSVRDAFAINYGTGGLGAEILANRFGVGPTYDCAECKYEEFFLTSWVVTDPAIVVDVPANKTDQSGNLIPGPKATKAFFPDDPSNVYHSYIGDHVKMRISHGGSKEHHIHHLHAHQWLHTPDDDNSTYLDSQALGPGSGFTLEIAHNGSGNRNQVVGDAIFHCHFYPHFAQGMWALWRNHDVFEGGTPLDTNGRPAVGARALPDGEIVAGTPIPAIVPLPTKVMPPLPQAQVKIVHLPDLPGGQIQITGSGNPGYPFFVPGVAGHRPPHPPMDTIEDGGLPRHLITGGQFIENHDRLDFSKTLLIANARPIPENGAPVEVAAMNYHAVRLHPSFKPDGTAGSFITNGLPAVQGAPFSDPCIDDQGHAIGSPRVYKAADFQLDLKLNKAGWHFPQFRMTSLWVDVNPTLNAAKPPEPLFFRANTNDCIRYYLVNLVPNIYDLDDFQVRTPTDVLGQHIHLVKFDVTSSDGAGNGFNYEDGSFSPDEVRERIDAINAGGGLGGVQLTPRAHPFFGPGPNNAWVGAQETIQRWFADDVLNNLGQDRTLRTVFTHDHFGPSTHQQAALYAGLVIEPLNSRWRNPESPNPASPIFYGEGPRAQIDGGPTSFRADILTQDAAKSYREFLLEFSDFTLAYNAANDPRTPNLSINPPVKNEVGLPFILRRAQQCPGGVPLPCPEAISAADVGTMTVNYRNEPVALRVRNPQTNTQAAGDAGNLSKVYLSNVVRADGRLNVQPTFYPPLTADVQPKDPFTPLLRAYENDHVQIRILVGAHEEGHNFTVHGVKWLFEPGTPGQTTQNNTGFRNSQMMGISGHFEFDVPQMPHNTLGSFGDFLYQPGKAVDDQWNGEWGLLRAYRAVRQDLLPLPNNPNGNAGNPSPDLFNGVCPKSAPVRSFDVTAVTAQAVLPNGKLIYNSRTTTVTNPITGETHAGPLNDPTAILYVRTSDIDTTTGKLKAGVPVEPLILRAASGDCINVTLRNNLPAAPPDLNGFNTMPMIVDDFNANQVLPSNLVGLHPQLVFYDVTRSDGHNVGFNPIQTAAPGGQTTYQWYAGDIKVQNGSFVANAVEFGAINLMPADPIKHSNKGAIGALIIEPKNSTWTEDANSRAQALVTTTTTVGTSVVVNTFRDFVVMFQNDINMRYGDGTAVKNLAQEEDPEDSAQKAVNYRTEPIWFRKGYAPESTLQFTRTQNFSAVLSNTQISANPQTPIFTASVRTPVRFRVLHPGGHARNHVFDLHGHTWEEEPYTSNSTVLGSNPFSEWKGAQMGHGPSNHFDVLVKHGAGGAFAITGDYLWRDMQSFQFDSGIWGIFRVTQ